MLKLAANKGKSQNYGQCCVVSHQSGAVGFVMNGSVGRRNDDGICMAGLEAFSMTEISFTNEISVTKHDITGKVGEV